MVTFSDDELTFVLKALIEHKEKLGRMGAYPKQKEDMKPYEALIQKLTKYRRSRSRERPRRADG